VILDQGSRCLRYDSNRKYPEYKSSRSSLRTADNKAEEMVHTGTCKYFCLELSKSGWRCNAELEVSIVKIKRKTLKRLARKMLRSQGRFKTIHAKSN
jgi:hypothetical protein